MAGTKLDGAGTAKMGTLDDALTQLQRLHGLVEQLAMALKRNQNTSMYGMQIRRAATPLVGLLKPQFGMISDQVVALNLVAGRGGNEQVKVRSLREAVAAVRTQLELAMSKVKDLHTVEIETGGDDESP
jgi:hypothetical protein